MVSTNGNIDLISGIFVAFLLASVAIGIDIQNTIKTRLGDGANTFALAVWEGWAVLIAWGSFDALCYAFVYFHKDWAKETIPFVAATAGIWTSVAVGVSVLLLIRSNLAKVAHVEFGFEYFYLWSRAYVLNAVNRDRVNKRMQCEATYFPVAEDVAAYPNLFGDLEAWLKQRAPTLSDAARSRVELQISEIKKQTTQPQNSDSNARKYLFGLAFDYFPRAEIAEFTRNRYRI